MNLLSSLKSWFSSGGDLSTKSDPTYQIGAQFYSPGQPIWSDRNYASFVKEGYKKCGAVYACVNKIAGAAAGIKWKLYTDDSMKREITSHPLLDLWKCPNPRMGTAELVEQFFGFWHLDGNAYLWANQLNPNEPPVELWPLHPNLIKVVAGQYDIQSYVYGWGTSGVQDFEPDQIMHLKFTSYDDKPHYGLSPIEVAMRTVDQLNAGNDWNTALMQNDARPSALFSSKGYLTTEQRTQVKRELKSKYSGKGNAGKPLVLEADMSYQQMAIPPKELDWLLSRKANNHDISMIFDVPIILLADYDGATYANRKEAKQSLFTENVLPKMDRAVGHVNMWLVSKYADLKRMGAYFTYDKKDIEVLAELYTAVEQALSEKADKMWMNGECDLYTVQVMQGLEPDPNAKGIYRLGGILLRSDDLPIYAQQALQKPAAPPSPVPEPLLNQPAPGQPAAALPAPTPTKKPVGTTTVTELPPDKMDEGGKSRWMKASSDEHTGIMIALFLDDATAKQLAIPGGESPDDLHITLAYIPDASNVNVPTLKQLLGGYASEASPLEGTITGVGRFAPSDPSDGLSPIYASVNIAGIQAFRADLVEQLTATGVEVAQNFEYMPHITLAYTNTDEPMPIESVPPDIALSFDRVWLAVGNDRYSFPIGDEQPNNPEKRRHTVLSVKVLDLASKEEKSAYMAQVEQRRAKWEGEIEQRLQNYFGDERKPVVNAIKACSVESEIDDAVDTALAGQQDALMQVIYNTWVDVSTDIGGQVAADLIGKKGAIADFIALFGSSQIKYLLTLAGNKIKQISATTQAQIRLELTQGVALGESIPELAKRIDNLYPEQIIPNRSKVIAQAEVLGSSNYASHEAAKQSGLSLKKVFLATGDNRTRQDHADADGQAVAIDEPFDVGGYKMMYPGDFSMGAPASEICGCRCTQYYERVKPSPEEEGNEKSLTIVDVQASRRAQFRAFMYANMQKHLPDRHDQSSHGRQREFSDALEGMSTSAKEAWFEEHGGARWIRNLTSEEEEGISRYTGDSYRAMNGYLRGRAGYDSEDVVEAVNQAESGLLKARAPADFIVARGYGDSQLQHFIDAADNKQFFMERGFLSTTIRDKPTFDGFRVNIKVFKGSPGAYVAPLSEHSYEREFLIPPGAKLRVTGATQSEFGDWTFDVEYRGTLSKRPRKSNMMTGFSLPLQPEQKDHAPDKNEDDEGGLMSDKFVGEEGIVWLTGDGEEENDEEKD